MTSYTTKSLIGAAMAASLLLGSAGAAVAVGGGNSSSGSGLSPYASESGNDRSAGVNNGNYSPPRYNYYRRAYGPRDLPYAPRRYEGWSY